MKAFLRSMTGRVFLTLLLGTVISFVLAQLMLEKQQYQIMQEYRDVFALDRSEQLIFSAEVVPASARAAYLRAANRPGIRLEEITEEMPVTAQPSPFAAALGARIGHDYRLDTIALRPASCDVPRMENSVFGHTMKKWTGVCESANVRMRDGTRLRLQVFPPPTSVMSGLSDYRMIILLFLGSMIVLAYLVARMSTRPLKQLAQAAKDLGNDINHPPLRLAGTSEIRQASAAFNAMQARVRQHIFQRTQMLAAITHDLQTPLTRLRLRLEKVGDAELQQRLVGDLSAMQEMVREGLDLARSMDTAESMQALDLDSLLGSVCCDATDAGQRVEVTGHTGRALMGRPMALRRCLVNLIDNAVKYGQQASVTVESVSGAARIRIRDQGPGIASSELARVFEPFYRIETSRSRESGGTGLGLTIALNIAEQHGGSIALANHPDGGLEVTMVLPEYYAAR
ncbi:MAG: ATP-binding protein [Pseudomonadota bacterium]